MLDLIGKVFRPHSMQRDADVVEPAVSPVELPPSRRNAVTVDEGDDRLFIYKDGAFWGAVRTSQLYRDTARALALQQFEQSDPAAFWAVL